MPDLRGWILQQINATEARARACPPSPHPVDSASDYVGADILDAAGRVWATGLYISPAAVLRRCAADRRILERHNVDPARADWPSEATACHGCGVSGDCDWPVTDHINDCPELLDLAAGYGLTDDQLAELDRPQGPEPEYRSLTEAIDALGRQVDQMLRPTTPTSAVPAALRGPNWKATP